MAVATLEREIKTLEKTESTDKVKSGIGYATRNIEDEQHNAKIGEVYARLINPSVKIDEILGRTATEEPAVSNNTYRPYLVENARADADIFRADSPVNSKAAVYDELDAEEEENEDLRPTPTTIQYKTTGLKSAVEEDRIETRSAEKRSVFSKKEKIAIAVVIGVIIAMFALIIINSAILSGINAEVSALQSTLTTVKASYASVSDEVSSLISSAVRDAEDFAILKGMIK